MTDQAMLDQIKKDVTENDVVLYIKGTKVFPQCGFSAVVVNILTTMGVDFLAVNILDDPAIFEAAKEYANWPTSPQVYIKGEFIGGCDIMKDMYESGELQDLFTEKGIAFKQAA